MRLIVENKTLRYIERVLNWGEVVGYHRFTHMIMGRAHFEIGEVIYTINGINDTLNGEYVVPEDDDLLYKCLLETYIRLGNPSGTTELCYLMEEDRHLIYEQFREIWVDFTKRDWGIKIEDGLPVEPKYRRLLTQDFRQYMQEILDSGKLVYLEPITTQK